MLAESRRDFLRGQGEDRLFLLGGVGKGPADAQVGGDLAGDGAVTGATHLLRLHESLLGVVDFLGRRAVLQESLQFLHHRGSHLVDVGRVGGDSDGQ